MIQNYFTWKSIFIILYLLRSTIVSADIQNDCYFRETKQSVIVGNSRIEIRIDPVSGAVTGLLNKITGTEYIGKSSSEIFRLGYSTWEFQGVPANDIWSATDGIIIRSSFQKIASKHYEKTQDGLLLRVTYDHLFLEKRTADVVISYTIKLRSGDEEIRWGLSIQNNSQGIIKEVHFPIISGLNRFDALIMPNESGQKLPDPIGKLSDEIPVISLEYPGRGSMQWFEYYSQKAGLYMASYDSNLNYTQMCFGRIGDGPEVAMWIVKYPFTASGASWESPDLSTGAYAGDWHWGANRYRSWLESWIQKSEVPLKIVEMIGGLGEIGIKASDGTVLNTYNSMAAMARQVQKSPNSVSFMIAGWMYNGHDTYYPEYYPIPDLGGEQSLIRAIDSVHNHGVSVTAYVNGRLCNIETDTYKKYGKRWSVLGKTPGLGVNSTDFFELHENWNKSWDRAKLGEGWFAVMCPYVKEWQDHLVGEVSRVIGEYHFDGIFLDQPGSYYAELCYNDKHGHSNPASAWGPGLLELFRRIRQEMRRLDPDAILWTEGMNDAFGQYMDYYMDKNPLWMPMRIHPECETFVEMWRYTLPDYIIVNDPQSYSYIPSQDKVYGLNYAFVLGIRGISQSPERGLDNKGEETDDEALRRAVVERIEHLWIKGGEYLFHGKFIDDIGLKVSDPGVLAKVYRAASGIAVPVWNTKSVPVKTDIWIDLVAAGLPEATEIQATWLDTGAQLIQDISGRTIKVTLELPAHEVDVVIFKTKN
jgi:hypothetical protein